MTKKLEGKWSRRGKAVGILHLAEAANLARLHRRKAAKADRDARAMDAQAKRVGAAIRRDVRMQQGRHMEWLTVSPARKSGRNSGQRKLARFEAMTGTASLPSYIGADGLSSFHFSWRSRGLRPRKGQKISHAYRRGEAVRLVKYILRDAAREIEGGGIVSSISDDPDEIASVLNAVEELEMMAGQENANVYISMVISLPHELDAAGRQRVLAFVTEALREEELPFAAVLHKPDVGTDQRNFHAHIVTSLRPFRKEANGTYSFAAASSSDLNDGEWIRPLRERIAGAINEEMAQLEVETGTPQRVFTHLSHADRGLAPSNSAEGKRGPGRSAEARRAAEVEAAQAEIGLRNDELKILDELALLVTSLATHVPLDVAAILRAARERVAKQAAALAATARASESRARLAALSRPSSRQLPSGPKPFDRSADLGKPNWIRRGSSLSKAPSLGTIPPLGKLRSIGGTAPIRGVTRQAPAAWAAPPSTSPASPSQLVVAEAGETRSAVLPSSTAAPVTSSPLNDAGAGSPSSSIGRVAPQPGSLEQALAVAAALPFVPLWPREFGDGTTRYLVDDRYITDLSVLAKVRLIWQHQRDPRMQNVLQGKYVGMQQAVTAELTTSKTVRPGGRLSKMFDHNSMLAAAVRSAWKHPSFDSVIDEARDYWKRHEAASSDPASSDVATASAPKAPDDGGLSAEDQLKQMKEQRGSGR